MRLSELEPQFLKVQDSGHFPHAETVAEAHGIHFVCPKCGDHSVGVWFADRPVPAELRPRPRWRASGSGYEDLTLAPSINLVDDDGHTVACGWHGFVTNGEIITCG